MDIVDITEMSINRRSLIYSVNVNVNVNVKVNVRDPGRSRAPAWCSRQLPPQLREQLLLTTSKFLKSNSSIFYESSHPNSAQFLRNFYEILIVCQVPIQGFVSFRFYELHYGYNQLCQFFG